MKTITLFSEVGSFAEDKDAAAVLRKTIILPTLAAGGKVSIDFEGVTLTTQSFVHALISEALRQEGEAGLRKLHFKNCLPAIKGIIETVVQYVLETVEEDEPDTKATKKTKKGK